MFLQKFKFSHLLLLITACLMSGTVYSQTANYEAAKWETKVVKRSPVKTIPPPNTTASKIELTAIRKEIGGIEQKELKNISYWNTGAPAYRWNELAPKLMSMDRIDVLFRMPTAWMNLAIYDATILAWREKLKYKRKRPNQLDPFLKSPIESPKTYSYPCEHSVTAAAAAHVLGYFFPEKKDSIIRLAMSASQSRVDAGVQFPSDIKAGWKLGEEVAKIIIEKAKKDGSGNVWKGAVNTDPKKWTGPFAMGIDVQLFTPIVLLTADQFRPPPPPDFKEEMKELKNFKQTFRSSSLAYFWANNGDLNYWNQLANKKMFEYRISDDAPAVARIYSMLHAGFHDATIASFDAKYAYWGIRPDQYDTNFKPLLDTPPFPGYPAGHALGAGTSSAILTHFFPEDAKEFQKIAQDVADSRFYAGVHFKSDNETGLKMGKELGNYITSAWYSK